MKRTIHERKSGTKNLRLGRIAVVTAYLCAMVFCSVSRADDVYGNVLLWMRGMGVDTNGNGILDANELRDSMNNVSFSSSDVTVYNGGTGVRFTNETVRLPYRGTTRTMTALHLDQKTVVTNVETGVGYMEQSTIRILERLRPLIGSENYAFAIRFRPDETRPHPSQACLLSLGYSSDHGMQISYDKLFDRTVTSNGKTYTNQVGRLRFAIGGTGWSPAETLNEGNMSLPCVGIGEWNDMVVSVDGKTLTVLVSRDGHKQNGDSAGESLVNRFTTSLASKTITSGTLAPASANGVILRIGAFDNVDGRIAWTGQTTDNNYRKCFRGCIQSFAVWTNSLTETQMREAAAWPRPDLWRVGVENGTAAEFNGGSGDVAVDADRWNVPGEISAGGNVTFKFPLDTVGEAEMNEVFRLKLTTDSSTASVRAVVNGNDIGSRQIQSGCEGYWFVPARYLQAGVTNTLAITRTDSGAGTMKIDTLALGGSLQYGKRDNLGNEFVREYDTTGTYDLIGGNWFDGRKIIYGQGAAAGNLQYTNIVVKFAVPDRLRTRYSWRLKWRMLRNGGDSYVLNPRLNGVSLGEFAIDSQEHEVKLTDGILQADNALSLVNVGGADRQGGALVDYVRLSIYRKIFEITFR